MSHSFFKVTKHAAFKEFLAANPSLVEMRDPPRVYFLDESRGMFPASVVAKCIECIESQERSDFQIIDVEAEARQLEAEAASAANEVVVQAP